LRKKSNFGKKKKKKMKKKGKLKKNTKYKNKKRNALWITVVIHGAFGCGETMIPPTPFRCMYNVFVLFFFKSS
jgi:hypothetical protein